MPISTIGQNGLNAPLSLTSPALGTPSSLVLTNATGLPQAGLGTNVVGNGPVFSACASGSQALTQNTWNKVLFGTEIFDTNNNFASSRFTPTVAGYYQINYEVYGTTSNTMTQFIGALYKNGSVYEYGVITALNQTQAFSSATLVYMNGSTDYLELYINIAGTGTLSATEAGGATNFMSGCLVRAA